MAKCLAKDRHDQPCRFKSLADSRFCKNHQYMNDYTDEMLAATIRCNGCMKHYYLQKGNKNCDKCKERGKKNREKKKEVKILCNKDGCKYKRSIENAYCNLHQRCLFEDEVKAQNKKCCYNVTRGCRAILELTYRFSKCSECLEKEREKDRVRKGYKGIAKRLEIKNNLSDDSEEILDEKEKLFIFDHSNSKENEKEIILNFCKINSLDIIEMLKGTISKIGRSANKEKNIKAIVKHKNMENNMILMYCESKRITIFDYNLLEKINEYPTWYYCKNGYIGCHFEDSCLYLHQLIMDHKGNGKGQDSVDHINRDKLDNRLENLRIINQSEQNKNRGKVRRKKNAQALPEELEGIQLPKYVNYCTEVMNKGKDSETIREFFRVEKHPNLTKKCISTSKSAKYSITEKLEEAKKILKRLNQVELEV